MGRLNAGTLAGGIVIVLIGAWMLAHDAGIVGMSLASTGPALLAAAGLVLVVSGLARRE